ncbi:hypothetical protein PRIPAC_96668 [Pristionchus pacificus]|uniref:Uncharacterized protein n=1 Tax=Pristionchus pacificus TaxID=54126 RepID=A0A2A6B378_PRIPA|nr:hypothetical protein PRIPAC_96668 [Pristionchus pacificus]|eukprot:PDM60335.1 hypothetical protein PRIPAC_54160 [Pristionchus pacificus]
MALIETTALLEESGATLRAFVHGFLPHLEIVHFVLCALSVREDFSWHWGAKRNPLGSWLFTATRCLAGPIISYFLLGYPPLILSLTDTIKLTKITVIWALVFYSPRDCVYAIFEPRTTAREAFVLLKEVQRAHKVYLGWADVPSADSLTKFVSAARGAGNGLIRNIQQIAMGTGSLSTTNEFIHPSTAAKVAIASAAAFTFIDVNRNLTYLVVVHTVIVLKAAPIAGRPLLGLR